MAYGEDSAAFIVRVWIEPREVEGAPVTWRGSIEHVPSGRVKYVKELEEIGWVVGGVLEGMGVETLYEKRCRADAQSMK